MERFKLTLGLPEANNQNVVQREAVRAVFFRDDHILMMLSNKGDYKFPGGGIEGKETARTPLGGKYEKKQDIQSPVL